MQIERKTEKWCLSLDIVAYIRFFYYYLFVSAGFITRYAYLCFRWLSDKRKLDVNKVRYLLFQIVSLYEHTE